MFKCNIKNIGVLDSLVVYKYRHYFIMILCIMYYDVNVLLRQVPAFIMSCGLPMVKTKM